MSETARFDEEIMEEITALTTQLIKHKELRSVAVLVDWDLPTPAANALPVGAWRPRNDAELSVATTGMQIQLPKMSLYLAQTLLAAQQATLTSKPQPEEAKA